MFTNYIMDIIGCDLMLNWNVMQLPATEARTAPSCDLMLNWNVMQFSRRDSVWLICCDLMLNWNVMQSVHHIIFDYLVVI